MKTLFKSSNRVPMRSMADGREPEIARKSLDQSIQKLEVFLDVSTCVREKRILSEVCAFGRLSDDIFDGYVAAFIGLSGSSEQNHH